MSAPGRPVIHLADSTHSDAVRRWRWKLAQQRRRKKIRDQGGRTLSIVLTVDAALALRQLKRRSKFEIADLVSRLIVGAAKPMPNDDVGLLREVHQRANAPRPGPILRALAATLRLPVQRALLTSLKGFLKELHAEAGHQRDLFARKRSADEVLDLVAQRLERFIESLNAQTLESD